MRNLCTLLLLGVLVIAGAGFYFHWWGISTTSGSEHSQVNVIVNKEKIRQDINKARNQVDTLTGEAGQSSNDAAPASSRL